jgi:hypothetical protein
LKARRVRLGFVVIVAVVVGSLGAGAAFAGGWFRTSSPAPIAPANVGWLRPDAVGTLTYPDGRVSVPATPAAQASARVTAAAAIQIANTRFPWGVPASQMEVALRTVTDPVMAGATELVPVNNRLVWVVTYRNSPFIDYGPRDAPQVDPASVFCVFVALVDANSGQTLSGDQYCRGANGQD